MRELPPEIAAFYADGAEAERLDRDLGRLELARMQELLRRRFPSPPAVVGDIGGGPGRYACWLAQLGFAVHLVDPIPLHVEQARAAARHAASPLASCRLGDARRLPFADRSLDAVLLHGPLYHLTERADRIEALGEAARVLRPGGVLAAVAITRFASAVVGLVNGWMADDDYLDMVRTEIATGQHRRPSGWRVFTTAYFHDVAELREELLEAGLEHHATLGVQGPGWLAPGFESMSPQSAEWTRLVDVARLVENDPVLSPHMLAVASKRS
jgi:ubiquinone/menaquinone biosynthesis C-methylase UbiE